MPIKPRLRDLVLFAPLALVPAVSAHAAPKSKKPSKPTQSHPSTKSAPAKPTPAKPAPAKPKPTKGKAKSGKKNASKALSKLSKEEYVTAASGKHFEVRSTMVLTPARPKKDARNYLTAKAYAPMAWAPQTGRDGVISIDGSVGYDGYWWNYAYLRFRAAANQQYLVDCVVSVHKPLPGKTPDIVMDVIGVGGAATLKDGHALRYLPASPEARAMGVMIYGTSNGIELSRCEVSLLE